MGEVEAAVQRRRARGADKRHAELLEPVGPVVGRVACALRQLEEVAEAHAVGPRRGHGEVVFLAVMMMIVGIRIFSSNIIIVIITIIVIS